MSAIHRNRYTRFSLAMNCRFDGDDLPQIRPIDVEEHDESFPLSAPMDNVIEAMEMRFCRSPMSWPPPRRNRTHCLIPRINGMHLKLRSAARLASCHHAAARQRQRRRPHETSVATTPRRSGPRALAPRRSFGFRPTRLLRRSWLR